MVKVISVISYTTNLKFIAWASFSPVVHYSLYVPKGYEAGSARWPLMLYLHNDEHRSTDQSMVFEYGSSIDPRRDEKTRPTFPMIGLVPQLPEGRQWSDAEVAKITFSLMDEVAKLGRATVRRLRPGPVRGRPQRQHDATPDAGPDACQCWPSRREGRDGVRGPVELHRSQEQAKHSNRPSGGRDAVLSP